MTGLNNTRPHYGFRHKLTPECFERWAMCGLNQKSDSDHLFPVELALFHRGARSEMNVLELESVELFALRPTNLAFHGSFSQEINGEVVYLQCAGYIAVRGSGVLWIDDGVTPLDDPVR